MKTYVCSKCGAEGSITRLVTLDGWEGIAIDEEDGKLRAVLTGEFEAEWDSAMVGNYCCAECEQTTVTLDEAVRLGLDLECRSCGWEGTNSSDHPSSCDGEVLGEGASEVHPRQESLAVSA